MISEPGTPDANGGVVQPVNAKARAPPAPCAAALSSPPVVGGLIDSVVGMVTGTFYGAAPAVRVLLCPLLSLVRAMIPARWCSRAHARGMGFMATALGKW
jgi:hypothetical protein